MSISVAAYRANIPGEGFTFPRVLALHAAMDGAPRCVFAQSTFHYAVSAVGRRCHPPVFGWKKEE